MADLNIKKGQTDAPQEDNVLETLNKRKGIIIGAIVGIIAIVVLAGVIKSCSNASNKKAQAALAQTTINTINNPGDTTVVDQLLKVSEMDGDAANVAKLQLAANYYKDGKYQEAINVLEKAGVDSDVIEAGRLSLMGDCYANLGNLDKALSSFQKALGKAEGNKMVAPLLLVKEANIYREQGKYAEEAKCYKTVFEKYPEYTTNLNFDIRKYQVAAETRAAQGK